MPAITRRIGLLTTSLSVTFCAQRVISRTCMWSCRSLPTPGASSTISMPCCFKRSAGPTPESCSNCGELYAPLETRISLRARAALAPAIVILMLTAHIEQAVDRARTAEHFSARLEHLPAVQSRFWLGLVHPVDGFFLEQLSVAERHVDPEIGILRSGLQQQHGMFAVGTQAIGEHTSGRAGADDNVVEFRGVIVLVHLFPRTQPETGSEAVTGGQLPPGRGRGEKAVTPAVLRVSRSPAAGVRRTRRRPRAPRRFSGAPRTARFPP